MKVAIKRSGNSASLRIPSDVLKSLNLAIGDELSMTLTESGFSFEKIDEPRKGWFDAVTTEAAKSEAQTMENDFSALQAAQLDEWSSEYEW